LEAGFIWREPMVCNQGLQLVPVLFELKVNELDYDLIGQVDDALFHLTLFAADFYPVIHHEPDEEDEIYAVACEKEYVADGAGVRPEIGAEY